MNRRSFLKWAGLSAGLASGVGLGRSKARADRREVDDGFAILADATRCAGCRACEEACATANGMPLPDIEDEAVFDARRDTSETQWLVVNRNQTSKGEFFSRRSCMHCKTPACAAACLTKAMRKTVEGPVVWDEDRCMGCRYCMLSCPFDIPKYEYHSPNPKLQKCRMCWERTRKGEAPACVSDCSEEAIVFGRRDELLREARARIHKDPTAYHPDIYGEHEAGGTGLLYLSPVPFGELGLRTDLDDTPYPDLTREFLYAVPVVFTVVPALLLGLSHASRSRAEADDEGEHR